MANNIMCPICGKMFPPEEYELLDNGNPICPECAEKERENEEE